MRDWNTPARDRTGKPKANGSQGDPKRTRLRLVTNPLAASCPFQHRNEENAYEEVHPQIWHSEVVREPT